MIPFCDCGILGLRTSHPALFKEYAFENYERRMDCCLGTAVEGVEDFVAESADQQAQNNGKLTHIINMELHTIIYSLSFSHSLRSLQ